MHLRQIINADKTEIKVGAWRRGKVPKADFPCAKRAYGLSNSFEWCVIDFTALGAKCSVLVVLNQAKEKYQAILGVLTDAQLRILCTYEFHATEPGWHCHASCDEMDEVPRGFMRGPWVRRMPRPIRTHRRQVFGINNHREAERFAFDCYKIRTKGDLL